MGGGGGEEEEEMTDDAACFNCIETTHILGHYFDNITTFEHGIIYFERLFA